MSRSANGGWPGDPFGSADPFDVRSQLFARRIVLLHGTLDDELAGHVAASLMTLDAAGDERITLQVDSGDGSLTGAFTVIDTIDLVGVPVHTVCLGRAEGPALGVVAAGTHRAATPHARFRFREPHASVAGTAADLEHWAHHHQQQLARFVERLVEATGQPAEHIEADLAAGRYLDAEQALHYHLIDEVLRPGHGIRSLHTPRAH